MKRTRDGLRSPGAGLWTFGVADVLRERNHGARAIGWIIYPFAVNRKKCSVRRNELRSVMRVEIMTYFVRDTRFARIGVALHYRRMRWQRRPEIEGGGIIFKMHKIRDVHRVIKAMRDIIICRRGYFQSF